MKTKQARELGKRMAALVQAGQMTQAYVLLAPVLAERTPFDMLRRIGEPIGAGPLEEANIFLKRIAADKTEGGWVVIASVLEKQLDRDPAGAFARCRGYIIAADVWYAADILGEGVAGQALVAHFQPALDLLAPWREDDNRWVRRTVGVAVHFWAKRSRGAVEHTAQAEALLAFLEPMFEEREMDAVKGVGWGLKTLGRHYPDLVADWVAQQVVHRQRRHRALMLRKALTYLSDEQRARATGGDPSGFRNPKGLTRKVY
jgi:3-methyladenine DNA glycosylase AlkD